MPGGGIQNHIPRGLNGGCAEGVDKRPHRYLLQRIEFGAVLSERRDQGVRAHGDGGGAADEGIAARGADQSAVLDREYIAADRRHDSRYTVQTPTLHAGARQYLGGGKGHTAGTSTDETAAGGRARGGRGGGCRVGG